MTHRTCEDPTSSGRADPRARSGTRIHTNRPHATPRSSPLAFLFKSFPLLIPLVLFSIARPSPAGAQESDVESAVRTGDVEGTVTMAGAQTPLLGARIQIGNSRYVAASDSAGSFRIEGVPVGTHRLTVNFLNMSSAASEEVVVRVRGDRVVRVAVQLDVRVLPVAELRVAVRSQRVVGKMGGFDRRRELGFGTFITRAEIERRRWHRTSDLLRMVPGVAIVRPQGGLGNSVLVSRRSFNQRCPMQYYLDGVRQPLDAGFALDILPPQDIEGIEIYSGPAQTPAIFSYRGARCGVVAIWTKDPTRRSGG